MEKLNCCRICLLEDLREALSVIEVPDVPELSFSEVYQYVTGFSIDETGPQNFCPECAKELSNAYLFKKKCENNEKLFKMKVKKEPIEEPEVDAKIFQNNILFVPEVSNNYKDEKLYVCKDCEKPFEKKSELRNHQKIVHKSSSNQKTVCPHCGKSLKFSSLDSHIEMIHNKSDSCLYICHFCHNNYTSKTSIINHLRYQHMKKSPINCRYCPETFANDGSRRYHEVTIHTKDYKHICSICGMKCYNSALYRRHLISHTGEKNYMCNQCGARFGRRNTLNNHIATHTDTKEFICKICNAAFKTPKSLKTHQNVHQERKYECPVCQQRFLVNQSMRIHCSKAHPEYELPKKGTVMNKTALKRLQELKLKRAASPTSASMRDLTTS